MDIVRYNVFAMSTPSILIEETIGQLPKTWPAVALVLVFVNVVVRSL